jgi:hypothetical protein
MLTSRRAFLARSAGAVALSGISAWAFADAPAAVSESDPLAQQMGYKTDATQVDHTKFTQYVNGSACGNCMFFKGAAADSSAPCTIFGGKLVSAKGWCSAYARKP